MKKWKQKAIVQKIISYLPYGNKINFLFQKYITKGVYLSDEYFYDRLDHAKNHINSYLKYNNSSIPVNCLEIGTGWYPIVPISLFLAGAENIYSVDISILTSKERIKETLNKLIEAQKTGKLEQYVNVLPERIEVISNLIVDFDAISLNDMLKKMKIVYLIEDARTLSLPDNSIDLVNSNNTFEHIYPDILKPILKEFKRIVKKETGVMSHFIDMSDHFAHFDKSICIYNFLKYSEKTWKWIDNSIQPQNRLRICDYKEIYSTLNIPISDQTIRKGNVDEVASIILAKNFTHYPIEEIAVSHCHLISSMKQVEHF